MGTTEKRRALDTGYALATARRVAVRRRRLEKALATLASRSTGTTLESEKKRIEAAESHYRRLLAELPSIPSSDDLWAEHLEQTDSSDFGQVLSSDYPVVMLPLRLHTRFVRTNPLSKLPTQLRIRFVPDRIQVDGHQQELTFHERQLGEQYHDQLAEFEDPDFEGDHDQGRRAAWLRVCERVGPLRALFIVLITNPLDTDDPLPPLEAFEQLEAWSQAVRAGLLPERITVRCSRGSRVLTATTNSIQEPLSISVDPQEQSDMVNRDVPGEIAWLVDYDEAVKRGMAISIDDLSREDVKLGFESVVALGLRSSAPGLEGAQDLEELLAAQSFSQGVEFLKLGTPTNNSDEDAGFRRIPDPEALMALLAPQTLPRPSGDMDDEAFSMRPDGEVLADALGIERRVFAHAVGAGRIQQRPAMNMARLVWPTTWSYFFDQVFRADQAFTHLNKDHLEALYQHFLLYVRARGPLPSFRVGSTPYGVLPVSSLELWKENSLEKEQSRFDYVALLQIMFSSWRNMVRETPVIKPTEAMGYAAADLDERLLNILRMQASSVSFQASPVYGEILEHIDDVLFERLEPSEGLDQYFVDLVKSEAAFEKFEEVLKVLEVNEGLFLDPRDIDPLPDNPVIRTEPPVPVPPSSSRSGQGASSFLSGTIIQPEMLRDLHLPPSICLGNPIEMDLPITAQLGSEVLLWLADSPIAAIAARELTSTNLDSEATKTLLYKVLRHAMLYQYSKTACDILNLDMPFAPLTTGNEGKNESPLAILDTSITVLKHNNVEQVMTVANLLDSLVLDEANIPIKASTGYPHYNEIRLGALMQARDKLLKMREAARSLAEHEDRDLSLLFTEQLDLASHRLDAWITSLATRRLREQRRANPAGVHVGVYGWVTDLVPDNQVHDSAGYILAPSLDHAKAAAVLHTGYLTHKSNEQTLAVDLSSERVQRVRWTLEAIRAGNSLASVLGYRFEWALHEREDQIYLQQFLPELRKTYSLDQANMGEMESAAGVVVDGLALREAWLDLPENRLQELSSNDDSQLNQDQALVHMLQLPNLTPNQANAFREELTALDELYDALADATLSESVFQMVRGNDRAAQMAELMAGNSTSPPEMDVTKTPTSALHVQQHVIASFGGARTTWQKNWRHKTPRRLATGKRLNNWLGAMLGDPRSIVCEVRLAGEKPILISLAELEVAPIDVLSLLDSVDEPQDGLLERLIQHRVRELHGSQVTELKFAFDNEDTLERNDTRSFVQVSALVTALRHLVYGARPARPGDLLSPNTPIPSQWRGVDVDELTQRTIDAVRRMHHMVREAEVAFARLMAYQSPTDVVLQFALDACVPLWAYGIPSALSDASINNHDPTQRIRLAKEALKACVEDGRKRVNEALRINRDDTTSNTNVANFARQMQEQLAVILAGQEELAASQSSDQASLEDIVEAATSLDHQIRKITEHCQETLVALFGHRFPLMFEFALGSNHPLAASHEDRIGTTEVEAWLHRLGRIHTALGDWEMASMISQAQGGAQNVSQLAPTQSPWSQNAPWVGERLEAEAMKRGVHSVVFAGQVEFGQPFAGLMLASFSEALPKESEQGGLTFQFDRPSAEAPQAVLLAVAPDPIGKPHWDQDTLYQILEEALSLASIRTIDPDSMRGFGSLLPAMYFTYNPQHQDVSTLLIAEEDMPQHYWLVGSEITHGGES